MKYSNRTHFCIENNSVAVNLDTDRQGSGNVSVPWVVFKLGCGWCGHLVPRVFRVELEIVGL